MNLLGHEAVSVSGTLVLELADGREATLEVHPLSLVGLSPFGEDDDRPYLVTGTRYERTGIRYVNGPAQLLVNAALRSTDRGGKLFTITVPTHNVIPGVW